MASVGVIESIDRQFPFDGNCLALFVVEVEPATETASRRFPFLGKDIVRPRHVDTLRRLVFLLFEERPIRFLLSLVAFRHHERRTTGAGEHQQAG